MFNSFHFYGDSAQFIRIFFAKKYQRLIIRLVTSFIFILSVCFLAGVFIFDYQHNNIVYEYLMEEDDLAVLSATFYKSSKSFPNSTVVILFNAHQIFHLKHKKLELISSNATITKKTSLQVRQVVGMVPFYCKWVPYLAVGQLVENADWLEFSKGSDGINVEMREPYREKHEVVSCFSPMFLNENWELLLLTAEVYSYYGAFLQFYVRSMISPVMEMLKTYKNSRINPWPGVRLGGQRAASPIFNANLELEFRNQAAAMTDCLLMYKEAATYILFPDPDDLIIPRNGFNYFSEFNGIFKAHPKAATVAYNMTQVELASTYSPTLYNPVGVIKSFRFRGQHRWGKLVVRPELVDSVWIHQSYDVRKDFDQIALPIEINSALHLRFWTLQKEPPVSKITKYNPFAKKEAYGNDVILPEDLEKIGKVFKKRREANKSVYKKLPAYLLYYPLLERCYNKVFYNGEHHSTCKSPELCEIPPLPGINCTNVEYSYETFKTKKYPLYVHVLREYKFVGSDSGCTL